MEGGLVSLFWGCWILGRGKGRLMRLGMGGGEGFGGGLGWDWGKGEGLGRGVWCGWRVGSGVLSVLCDRVLWYTIFGCNYVIVICVELSERISRPVLHESISRCNQVPNLSREPPSKPSKFIEKKVRKPKRLELERYGIIFWPYQ